LLRPDNLHRARKAFKEGTINQEQLRLVETQEIRRIVDKQIEAGMELVTDGNSAAHGGILTFWSILMVWRDTYHAKGGHSKGSRPKNTMCIIPGKYLLTQITHSYATLKNLT